MAFRMNKPIIHGSGEHSALLAKAERIPTHGADPSIMAAVVDYSKSNSPDVIDWQIKIGEIELAEKEKEEEEEKVEKKTVSERKTEIAKVDEEAAIKRLEEAARKRYESKKMTQIPTLGAAELPKAILEEKIIEAKKLEKKPGQYYEEGSLITGDIGGVPTHSLKTSYTEEEQKRLIFSEEHGRMVLPEEIGIKSVPVVESPELDKELEEALIKSEKKKEKKVEKKTTTKKRNVAEDLKYKRASAYIKAQMIRRGYIPK
jgi:hypothetical protein